MGAFFFCLVFLAILRGESIWIQKSKSFSESTNDIVTLPTFQLGVAPKALLATSEGLKIISSWHEEDTLNGRLNILGFLEGFEALKIRLLSNTIAAVATSPKNLVIVDVSKNNPTMIASLELTPCALAPHFISRSQDGTMIFILCDETLVAVDVQTHSNPTILGFLRDKTALAGCRWIAQTADDSGLSRWLIILAEKANHLVAIDAKAIEKMILISTIGGIPEINRPRVSIIQGMVVYVISNEGYIVAMDFTYPAEPYIIESKLDRRLLGAKSVVRSGRYAFITTIGGRIVQLDLEQENPSLPALPLENVHVRSSIQDRALIGIDGITTWYHYILVVSPRLQSIIQLDICHCNEKVSMCEKSTSGQWDCSCGPFFTQKDIFCVPESLSYHTNLYRDACTNSFCTKNLWESIRDEL